MPAATIGCVARERIETLLRDAFPEAPELSVEDRTGGGDHFQVAVKSARFNGLSLVEQHRLVYDALAAVEADESLDEVFAALSGGSPAVVVATRGRPTGMLTRSDLLEYLAHGRSNAR